MNYLKSIDNELASLRDLTIKCTSLLALTTGQRVQTLAALNLDNFRDLGHKVIFNINQLLKTSRPGSHVTVDIAQFSQDIAVCPVACLCS